MILRRFITIKSKTFLQIWLELIRMKAKVISMQHLTFDEIFTYFKTNENNMSADRITLVEKVSSHFDECERCLRIYNEIMVRHCVAEYIVGATIPLEENAQTLADAVKSNDLIDTAHAALRRIIGAAVDISGELFDLVDRLLTEGFEVASSKAKFALAGAATRGAVNGNVDGITENQILVQLGENSVMLEESGRINIDCSDKDAASALVVSKDGEYAELYPLVKKYGKNGATTKTLPPNEYKIIFLHE